MAKIPQYGVPEQQARVLPSVRSTDSPARAIAAVGETYARAGQQVAQAMSGVALEMQERADTVKLMEAERALIDVDAQLLNDPEKGAFARTRGHAIGVTGQVLPEWDRNVGAVGDKLPAHLRQKFGEFVMRRRSSTADRLMNHELRQTQEHEDEVATSTASSYAANAGRNWQDPSKVEEELMLGASVLREHARLRGFSEQGQMAVVREYYSKGQAEVLSGMIGRGQHREAADRLADLRDDLDPAVVSKLDDALHGLLLQDSVEASIDEMFAGVGYAVELPAGEDGAPGKAPELPSNAREVQATYADLGAKHGFKTTSTTRSPDENRRVKGVPHSQHLTDRGTARDWSVKGKTPAQVAAFVADLEAQGFEVITKNHGTGPHIHAELPPGGRRAPGEKRTRVADAPAPSTLGELLSRVESHPMARDRAWARAAKDEARRRWSVMEADKQDRERASLDQMRELVANADATTPMANVLGVHYAEAARQGWLGTLGALRSDVHGGKVRQTDPVAIDEYATMLARDQSGFADRGTILKIMKDRRLSESDRLDLRSKWEAMQKPDARAKVAEEALSADELLGEQSLKFGWKGEGAAAKRGALAVAYRRNLEAWQAANPGKKPDNATRRSAMGDAAKAFATGDKTAVKAATSKQNALTGVLSGGRVRFANGEEITWDAQTRRDAEIAFQVAMRRKPVSEYELIQYALHDPEKQ